MRARVTVKREQSTACNAMIALLSQAQTGAVFRFQLTPAKQETAANEMGRMVQFAVRKS
jgi:hypothetical protein